VGSPEGWPAVRQAFATRREVIDEVIDWPTFYNHRRLHATLDYVSSMTFEQRWIADQQQFRKSA
jgi:putative transposase